MKKLIPEIKINIAHASSSDSLREILAASLDFPGCYGKNWNAFWDCLRDDEQSSMPEELTIKGWEILQARLPDDAKHLKKCFEDLGKERPEIKVKWESAE